MGTALTPDEKNEWTEFLRDMDSARRSDFVNRLAAAPASGKAYTLGDLRILDDVTDVETCVKEVAGMRTADVKYFLQYWNAHTGMVDTSNRPVIEARIMQPGRHGVRRARRFACGGS